MTVVGSLNKTLSFTKYVLSVDMLRYSKKLAEFKDTILLQVISIEVLQHRYMNQSTESADGGGFLHFYKPLDYISSALSFCSIFLDM